MFGLFEDLELQVDLAKSGKPIDFNTVEMFTLGGDVSQDVEIGPNDPIYTETSLGTGDYEAYPQTTVSPNVASSDSTLATAHVAIEQTKMQLRGMKRKFGLTTLEDPNELKAVKIAIDILKNAMKASIPQGDKEYAFALGNVIQSYDTLIRSCKDYEAFLNSRKMLFRRDRTMRQMIQQIIIQSETERDAFNNVVRGEYITGIRYGGNNWTDVLYAIRAERLDEKKLESEGANTSDLKIVVRPDGSESFIKQEERTLSGLDPTELLNMYAETLDPKAKSLIIEILKNKESIKKIDELYKDIAHSYFKDSTPVNKEEALKGILRYYSKEEVGSLFGEYFENFVLFIFRKLMESTVSSGTAAIESGSVISDRNVSTSRVADRLGVKDIVARSETIMVKRKDGGFSRANSMEGVTGPNVMVMYKLINKLKNEWKNYTVRFTGNAIKQFFELQVLDLICGQIDRHMGNYMAIFKIEPNKTNPGLCDCVIDAIKGIDNDLSFGNIDSDIVSPWGDISHSVGLYRGTNVNVPFISKKFYDRIMIHGMDSILVMDQFDLRSLSELDALKKRFTAVKDAIQTMVANGSMLVIEDEQEFEDRFYNRFGQPIRIGDSYITRVLKNLS